MKTAHDLVAQAKAQTHELSLAHRDRAGGLDIQNGDFDHVLSTPETGIWNPATLVFDQ